MNSVYFILIVIHRNRHSQLPVGDVNHNLSKNKRKINQYRKFTLFTQLRCITAHLIKVEIANNPMSY